MPNVIKISVENPDELLDAGLYDTGALIQTQSSATEAGVFADLTGTGSDPTVPIVTNVRSYTAMDPNGIVSTWYRTRYKNVAGTRASDWTAPFQVGDETAGLLCSLYDVKQDLGETGTGNDELILEKIRAVSDEIEDYVGAWLAPRPTNPASEMVLLFDVPSTTRSLYIEQGNRRLGIRAMSALGTATQSQPETGGTYTAATVSQILLRPRPTADGPASRLEWSDTTGGMFYRGYNTVQVTGSFGPASVMPRIQEIARSASIRRFLGKETATTGIIALGPEGGVKLLADLSPSMRATLDRMRIPPAA